MRDESLEGLSHPFGGTLRVETTDGRVIERRIPDPSGEPASFPESAAVRAKFMALAEPVLGARAADLCEALETLDALPSLAALFAPGGVAAEGESRMSALLGETTLISEDDFIVSIADALQFIAIYHPADYIENLARAYEREQSPAARNAMAQILVNSAHGGDRRPADVPGHRDGQRLRRDRHGRPHRLAPAGHGARRRGSRHRLHRRGQSLARLDRRRPALSAEKHPHECAGRHPYRAGRGRHRHREDRGQGRRIGEQGALCPR